MTVERQPVAAIWHCSTQLVACLHGHPMWFNKTGYRADFRDMAGHSFLECQTCSPSTYFLAVFYREPSPLVHCYALSRESYAEWQSRPGRTPPTDELLYLVRDPNGRSHFPTWRQPR